MSYRRLHGRRLRVATKYMNLTRRFFSQHGVSGYQIVESLGATEGAPAAHFAELIVDITTTGNTLRANELRTLSDGIILRSQAQLVSSKVASWSARLREIEQELVATLSRTHAPAEAKTRACHHSAKLRMRSSLRLSTRRTDTRKPGRNRTSLTGI